MEKEADKKKESKEKKPKTQEEIESEAAEELLRKNIHKKEDEYEY